MSKKTLTNRLFRWSKVLLSSLVLSITIIPQASAHLMVAQHGTLNVKDDGVFMVLSLPVSAFDNLDDNNDGRMSAKEFAKNKSNVVSAVNNKIRLSDETGSRPLQGLLITPVIPHSGNRLSEQLVIMGRFALDKMNIDKNNELTFHIGLFGQKSAEKTFNISASSDTKKRKHAFKISPTITSVELFSKNNSAL